MKPCPYPSFSFQMIGQHQIIASTLLLAVFNGSNAFSCNTKAIRRKVTALSAESSSSALHYRQGSDSNFAPSTLLYASSGAIEEGISTNAAEDDIELQIEEALKNARDADRKFRLRAQPSIKAWKIVDDLYMMSAASQKVEDSVKSVLGAEKSVWSLYE